MTSSNIVECPDWCTVDHSIDSYSRHDHLIHRARVATLPPPGDALSGVTVNLWQSAVRSDREIDTPLEVHVNGSLFHRFTDAGSLRRYADQYRAMLLTAADALDAEAV